MYYFIPLKAVAIAVGAAIVAARLPGVLKPQAYRDCLRKFPRAVWPGIVFLSIALVWCLIIVNNAREDGMAVPKNAVYLFLVGVYAGLIALKFDFLAVRGLAILLLMVAKIVVDSANQLETPWRLVMTVLAYVWAIAGMWFTVSPYRMRDLIEWATLTESRTRVLSAVGCVFGLVLIALGLFVY
ncbi:MAG: hypothetical protein HZA88_12360 [Verrucomicrobia bacterium]|nr:hypothetical protein [Verrucomicrobiota bacterium]